MPPRVLIVEDEAVLRAAMARGLAKLPAVIDEAATVAEAIAHLDRALPDVILSDLDLPDGSGIELVGELAKRKARVPLVFVSAYLRAYRAQIPPHADVEVREKPIELDELRALVRDRLGPRVTDEAPFGVADYVQLACIGKHSVAIDVIGRDGNHGLVAVVGGEIWHAEDDRGAGIAAFHRLTFAEGVEVHCRTLASPPGRRTVDGRWEALLMDSARIHDEGQRHAARTEDDLDVLFAGAVAALDDEDHGPRPPESPAVPEVASAPRLAAGTETSPIVDEFVTLRDRALDAVLDRDYPTAVRAFAAAHALRPDDQQVVANLERLAALGYSATLNPEKHDDETDRRR